jgi:kynurenine formamidase
MRLVDLSILVENSLSEPMKIKVKRFDHFKGAKKFCRQIAWNKRLPLIKRIKNLFDFISGKNKLSFNDFPQKAFLSLDVVTLPTHMGTHIDAPFHYGPTVQGEMGKTIDELPLEWFFNPAIKLDMRHKKPGEYITIPDIAKALEDIEYDLKPFDIVLLWTGSDRLWGKKEYFTHAPGMSREATKWLVERGIKVIGTDTYGFDRPFNKMLEDFWRTKNQEHLWPAHFYGREKEYIQIERLNNLAALPTKDFQMCCFPLRIKGLDASWVRAVAIMND